DPEPLPSLRGNGSLEFGKGGWAQHGGTFAQTSGKARTGSYSGVTTGRDGAWQGPAFVLPAGEGEYQVSVYASHNAAEDTELQLQAKFVCGEANTESYSSIEKKKIGRASCRERV